MFYPKQIESYDADCGTMVRTLTLEVEVSADNMCSTEEECIVMIAFSAASAVISGSIVIIGNSFYWLEETANCSTEETV